MAARGRPKSTNKKINLIGIRLAPDDLAHVKDLADRVKLSPGATIRLVLHRMTVDEIKEWIGS